MRFIREHFKTIASILIILILLELVVVGHMLGQFRENYLSGEEALSIALDDARLGADAREGAKIALKHKSGRAWYRVELKAGGASYVYEVDAETGAILSARAE